jgi:acyl carrier protein
MSIQNTVKNFITENILFSDNGYPYKLEDSFLEKGIVDSMNVMEIVAFVEETFGVTIKDSDIVPSNFDSIANITKFVETKKSAG